MGVWAHRDARGAPARCSCSDSRSPPGRGESAIAPFSVEGWTVKDVVSHLAYNQPTQPRLIRNILDGKGGTPANFDLAYFNRRGIEKQQGKEIPQLKADLAAGHAETIRLLDEISDSDLDKLGNHASAGNTTLEQIFRTIARHDREHTEHIREALRRR
jgi:hypothetical protein